MEEFKYDEIEMKIREQNFELAKGFTLLHSLLLVGEWDTMKAIYGFTDERFPIMASEVENARQLLDKNSPAHKAIFENPLTKLAVISQPMENKKDEDKKNE